VVSNLEATAMTAPIADKGLLACSAALSTRTGLHLWCRILDAVAEMRESLDHRIWREDPDDSSLEADFRAWIELTRGLADFLEASRAE
jgi:hypothetical protein